MKGTLKIVLILLALVFMLAISWKLPVGKSGQAKTSGAEKLVVLSPHWDGIRNEFGRAFPEWYLQKTGKSVFVEWLDQGGTSDDVRYIFSEFKRSPSGIGIDLFFGGGTDPYLEIKRNGLFASVEIDSSILGKIPQNFSGIALYDPEKFWFGAVLSGFGIVHNKWVERRMNLPVPQEWKDLADPRYFTWVGAADPRNSGTMHLMFEIILQSYGWQQGWRILTGIAANTRTFAKGAGEVPKMVAKGDLAVGLAIDFYGWTQVSEAGEDKVGFILPKNLTVISADAMAMLKGAPHPEAAKGFIEFVLSEDGQKLWFLAKGQPGGPEKQELNRMTVREDIYEKYKDRTNIRQNPFKEKTGFAFDQVVAGRRWAILNDLMGVALIDHGPELKEAWKASIQSKQTDDSLWLTLPVEESQCRNLAENEWKNPVEKNKILNRWHNFFSNKYGRVKERCIQPRT